MAGVITKWSAANLTGVKEILGRYQRHEYLEALVEVNRALGIVVSDAGLRTVFQRFQFGSPLLYLQPNGPKASNAEIIGVPPSKPPPMPPEHVRASAIRVPNCTPAKEVPPTPKPVGDTAADLRELRFKEQISDLEAAKKRLTAELRDLQEQLGVVGALKDQPSGMFVAKKGIGEGKRRQGTPVIMLSDWHVEEPVDLEKVNGLNEYNLDIADSCIKKCAEAFEWFATDKRYDCREAIVWLGGDLFSGWIHQELSESNFLSPVQAVEWLQSRIENMLRQMLATTKFERILVVCNDGNHGRLSHKTRVATRTANSLEWLLYKTLAMRMSGEKRLVWQIAEGEWNYVEVFSTSMATTHGDSFRYAGGVGGLLIPLRRGFNEVKKYRKADLMICGHFHQRTDTGEIVVNGSLIGISNYSLHIHAAPEPRQQSWFMIDSVKGKCISAPVWPD